MPFRRHERCEADADSESAKSGSLPDSPSRRIVAGLGNPGEEYAGTRHNIGFMIINRVARMLGASFVRHGKIARIAEADLSGVRTFLVKPRTFMNRSGHAVGQLAERLDVDVENILVVLDDFYLPVGKLRFRARGSDGGHNGLASVIRTLGTGDIPRLRCGIGTDKEEGDAADFVLASFHPDEAGAVEEMIDRAAEGVRLWLEKGDLELCMNRYNQSSAEKKQQSDGSDPAAPRD